MDGLLVLIGLAVLAGVLLGPIAFFLVLGARRRLTDIETQRDGARLRLRKLEDALQAGRAETAPAKASPGFEPVATPPVDAMTSTLPLGGPAPVTAAQAEAREILAADAPQPAATIADMGQLPPILAQLLQPRVSDPADESVQARTEPEAAFDHATPPLRPSTPAFSLEEALGTRWAVWVGGIALAFGALLLVRYSIEQGLFGPAVRLGMGAVLAACLVGAGEFLRRHELGSASTAVSGNAYIPGTLTAAGTIAAFGVIYAAHALYGYIGPAAALILLGATGIAAMLAAALHGPALAGLGLVGALATPLLVETHAPTAWPLVSFLAVVAGAAHGLAFWRKWRWLSLAAALGAGLWTVAMLAEPSVPEHLEFFLSKITHVLLQSALVGVFVGYLPHRTTKDADAKLDLLASLALCLLGFLAVACLAWGNDSGFFGPTWIASAFVSVVVFLTIGIAAPALAAASLIAGIIIRAIMVFWPKTDLVAPAIPGYFHYMPPLEAGQFGLFAFIATALVLVANSLRLWTSPALRPRVATFHCVAAALTPLLVLGFAYFSLVTARISWNFAGGALGLAAIFAILAVLFAGRFQATQGAAAKLALGSFAVATIASIALALAFATQNSTLTLALALTALGAAVVATVLDLTPVRHCVTALGLVICARFALEPRIIGAELVDAPRLFNWLLYGYGVPAACFAMAGWLMRRRREDTATRVADALAILFAALLAFLEIRHSLNGGVVDAPGSNLVEQALFTVTSLAFSIVLVRLDAARANIVFRYASIAAGVAGMLLAAIALLARFNPLFTDEPLQGSMPFNSLLLAYALPAILAAVLTWFARPVRPLWYWVASGVLASILAALFCGLEIRSAFHGQQIGLWRGLKLAEAGIDVSACLLLAAASAIASIRLAAQRPDNRLWLATTGFAALGAALAVLGPGVIANPLLVKTQLESVVLNQLVVAYALPTMLAAWLAWLGRRAAPMALRPVATIAAVLMLFAYANLAIRRLFQGPDIRLIPHGFLPDERVAYSALWLFLGVALLAIGIWRSSREARLGSAVLVVMSVIKIFIFDLAGLEGILRALSFIGLGLVLMAIGLVYQKLVFAKSVAKPVTKPVTGPVSHGRDIPQTEPEQRAAP